MKKAIGKATRLVVTVTSAAMPIVRSAIVRKISWVAIWV